jgi:hypothetical protein
MEEKKASHVLLISVLVSCAGTAWSLLWFIVMGGGEGCSMISSRTDTGEKAGSALIITVTLGRRSKRLFCFG